jgi:hypothetical protein
MSLKRAREPQSNEEDEYEVEKIVGVRTGKHGREYKVQWKGWPGADSWEPEGNCDGSETMIAQFHAEQLRDSLQASSSLWRAFYSALLFVWLANRVRLDYELQRTWEVIRASWWFKHDSFEPVLATLSFGSWILVWRTVDIACPSLHRWRIDANPVEPVKQGPLEFILRPGIGYCAAAAYLLPLLVFDQLYPRRVVPERSPRCAPILQRCDWLHCVTAACRDHPIKCWLSLTPVGKQLARASAQCDDFYRFVRLHLLLGASGTAQSPVATPQHTCNAPPAGAADCSRGSAPLLG